MTVATVRRAVAEMRKEADRATQGNWKLWGMSVMADQDGTSNVDTAVDVATTYSTNEKGSPRTYDATHISRWDPNMTRMIADWLEIEADHYEKHATQVLAVNLLIHTGDEPVNATVSLGYSTFSKAIEVAEAYLKKVP